MRRTVRKIKRTAFLTVLVLVAAPFALSMLAILLTENTWILPAAVTLGVGVLAWKIAAYVRRRRPKPERQLEQRIQH